jgi:uncharacterized membrane protein
MRWESRSISSQRRTEILNEVDQNGAVGPEYLVLVALSCIIATFGLAQDSTAILIGAALLTPLAGPVMVCALALIRGDAERLVRASVALIVGAIVTILLSVVLARLIGSLGTVDLSGTGTPAEIANRAQISLLDLGVGLAGGAAAAYALLVRSRLPYVLPHALIAIILLPPLCVVGIGLSQGDGHLWQGAALVLIASFTAVLAGGACVFALAGLGQAPPARQPVGSPPRGGTLVARARSFNAILLAPVALVLIIAVVLAVRQDQSTAATRSALESGIASMPGVELVGFTQSGDGDHLDIMATLRSTGALTIDQERALQEEVATTLGQRVALRLLVVPGVALSPVSPSVAGASGTPVARATETEQARAPRTPLPVAPTVLVPTTTPSFTPVPPAVRPRHGATAVVRGTHGFGANARSSPALNGAVVAVLPDGTVVQLTGKEANVDGFGWLEVRLPDGKLAWIATNFLGPATPQATATRTTHATPTRTPHVTATP